MQIAIIGHSTVLIETAGMRILTDPYFGKNVGPAFIRLRPPSQTREQLNDVDLVLISHSHWDHIDLAYLRSLENRTQIVTSALTEGLIKVIGTKRIISLRPWSEQQCDGVKITVVPAVHMVPTIGFIIQGEDKTIYFAGDTFCGDFMKTIAQSFQLDVALMPVTTFRVPMTMGVKQALEAVEVLKPKVVIPIHLGIDARLPFMRTGQTAEQFEEKVKESCLDCRVVMLKEGESYSV